MPLSAPTVTVRPRRVNITLYDEDLVLVNVLQMYTGVRTRSAIIRLALRELREHYRGNNQTIRNDVGREKS